MTPESRATGYQVLRGTTNGGPYTQVATMTSRATTSYQDNVPLPGQYFYVAANVLPVLDEREQQPGLRAGGV